MRLAIALLFALMLSPFAGADTATGPAQPAPTDLRFAQLTDLVADDGILVATVELDGVPLFRVRGLTSIPAKVRAKQIRDRLVAVAEDPDLDPAKTHVEKLPDRHVLSIDGQIVTNLLPADAAIEHVPLDILTEVTLKHMSEAIVRYREARSPRKLLATTGVLLGVSLIAALLAFATNAVFGWINRLIDGVVKRRIEHIEQASHRLVDAAQLWSWLGGIMRLLRALVLFAIALIWLNAALSLYPWTRPFAKNVFLLVLEPLQTMGAGIVNSVPNLAFLVVLTYLVRFLLNATKTFFLRIDRGWVRFENFEREWAMPTYRMVRITIIAFAVVVAYPYIPGSESEAFKGVSIFLGVIFSIGSSSFIANMLAGLSLTYRGAFREGDRLKIGDHVGEVIHVRALSTQLRSLKNEDVNIPNSEVLASAIVNYSTFAREKGLILHTDVGIGYDAPWRQVEAMLLQAAGRTGGVEKDPPPFVLQTGMGDFCVTYQLNAYCRDAKQLPGIYSALHAHIQDVFNEYGVQIMSPHYEVDPAAPKVVHPDNWFAAPARAPDSGE